MMDPPNQEAAPPKPMADELTSWKEIAQHLSVNVRTAQKWEKTRGLPVRRASGPRGLVSASVAELDGWKQQGVALKTIGRAYRWPLSPQLTVELRFEGAALEPAHVELLVAYLNLIKAALR